MWHWRPGAGRERRKGIFTQRREVVEDVNIDLDASGRLVGIDIHGNASQYVDLSSFQIETLET
ncbi:DUF2283 domain-containing protein [Leptospira andrefontaineae]|uniref:DUF2283 domain-containing protein n=1 Tax=Leptospira andrefontaineae TaxID=2484976 RepID=A0A4R9HBI8_9LEPT|nr:DUF2283 domain-containing protein [Leptospira andrefontaineae]